MLGWLAAVAAPLVIHLWSRHRYREAPWAAMQFLLAAMRKNARRLQLQQWLLLAVRMLIIALVVLAVAEPYGERLLASLSGEPTHKILVVDGSYSMAYRDDNETRFSRAKRIATQLVRDSRSADTFTVILMAAPAKTILGRDVVDHAAVIGQIEALTQPHTGADLPGALTLVDEAIKREAANPGRTMRHQVFFLTDLQRATWHPSDVSNTQQNPAAQRIASLSKLAEPVIIDLGSAQATNTAVTSLTSSEPLITVGREVTFDATMRQFGPAARDQCDVELLVDNVPVSEQTIDIETGADVAVRFNHRFQSPGEHSVEVRVPGDRLEIDNFRWLVVPVREEVRVLCVAGRPGAANYLADALNPSPAGDSPIRPIIISDGDLADVELTGFNCVFLCNVAQITTSDAERFRQFAQAGGGIVFFLGDRTDRENYNAHAAGKEPLLPATLGEVIDQREFGIDPLDYRHPIVAPFRGRERAGLLTTPIARYHRLALPNDRPDVQVAAALQNGDPFVVTAPLGLGKIILVATDGSLSSVDAASGEPWTNWPTWPSFLPIVRELLAYATSGRQQEWQQLVGTPLVSRVARNSPWRGVPAPVNTAPARVAPSTQKIERPDKHTAAVNIQSNSSNAEWTYSDTNLSGIYTLIEHTAESPSPQPPVPSPQRFAVNVDASESDLGQIDPRQLPAELHSLDAAQNGESRSGTADVSRAGWNESLLWSALALVFVESFLAWQFGRGAL
jgi:hypothetical protein